MTDHPSMLPWEAALTATRTDAIRALDHALDTPPDTVPDRPFAIGTLSAALWAVRRLKKVQQQITETHAAAAAEIATIKEWEIDRVSELASSVTYFESLLAPWVASQLEGGKKRSLKLLNATLGYHKQPTQLVYDEAEVLAWAKEHRREWLKVTESLLKTPIREDVEKAGEVIRVQDATTGTEHVLVTLDEQPDKFYVTFAKEAE